jgi:hypothetical protein
MKADKQSEFEWQTRRQATDGWGAAVGEQLAVDLSREFTGIDGFYRTK